MEIRADEISKIIREQIDGYRAGIDVSEVGTVVSVGDGIARVHGLERAMAGELLAFPHDVMGLALNLEESQVGVVLLGEYTEIREGDQVKRTGRIMEVPRSEEHTSELQSQSNLVCRLLLEKKINRRNIRRLITIPLTLSNLKLFRLITKTENILH